MAITNRDWKDQIITTVTTQPTNLKMVIDLYAIRHRPTGGWIPARRGRGGSHDEPTLGVLPRLFPSIHSATSFLSQWLLGKHVRHVTHGTHSGVVFGSFGDGDDEEVVIKPVPSRKKEEMEIVVFRAEEK